MLHFLSRSAEFVGRLHGDWQGRAYFAALLLAGALCGCASVDTGGKVWYKEGGTTEERDRLLAAAHVQGQQAHVGSSLGTSDTAASRRQSDVEATMTYMTAHGWQLVAPEQAKPLKRVPLTQTPPASATGSVGLDR